MTDWLNASHCMAESTAWLQWIPNSISFRNYIKDCCMKAQGAACLLFTVKTLKSNNLLFSDSSRVHKSTRVWYQTVNPKWLFLSIKSAFQGHQFHAKNRIDPSEINFHLKMYFCPAFDDSLHYFGRSFSNVFELKYWRTQNWFSLSGEIVWCHVKTIGHTMYYWKEHSFCQLKKEQQQGRRSTITGTVEATRIWVGM